VSLGLLVESEPLGRAGWVREKNWTLPTSGRRWPAPPPRQSCTVRRSCAAPAVAPRRGRGRHRQGPQHSRSGGRARACRTAEPRQRQGRGQRQQPPPHKGKRGGGGARGRRQANTRHAAACARGHRQSVRRPPTDRGGGDAREGGGAGAGSAWHPKRRATRHSVRRGRRTATALPHPHLSWHVPPTWRPTGNNHVAGYRKNPHSGHNS